jgi:hypothetical protein
LSDTVGGTRRIPHPGSLTETLKPKLLTFTWIKGKQRCCPNGIGEDFQCQIDEWLLTVGVRQNQKKKRDFMVDESVQSWMIKIRGLCGHLKMSLSVTM